MVATLDLVEPSEQMAEQSREALRLLSPHAELSGGSLDVRIGHDEAAVVHVPEQVARLLVRILAELANGNAVTVMPVNAELTTQQAADLLNVSRPYLVRLLQEGAIPHRKVGTRRRVLCADVLAYRRREMREARQVLDALTDEGQGLGLGY